MSSKNLNSARLLYLVLSSVAVSVLSGADMDGLSACITSRVESEKGLNASFLLYT